MSSLFFELTLAETKDCILAKDLMGTPTDAGVSYSLSNIQLLASYLKSPSLTNYWNSNAISYHVIDYSRRYETVTSKSALVRLPSAHSSLDGIVTVLREQSAMQGGMLYAGKNTNFVGGLDTSNLYINSHLFYDVDTDSNEQRYLHLASVFPKIKESENFSYHAYNLGGQFVLGVKVSAAPPEFSTHLISGTNTRNLTSDLVLKLTMYDIPPTPIVATTFLMASVLIHSDGSARGDLRIKY
jgi:hypothetical protein